MRRLGAVALATLVVGVACQKKDEGKQQQAAAPAAQAEAQPIVIGNVMPLTGEIATFGQGANNGVKLAIDEANAAGGVKGRKITLAVYDTTGKPEEAAIASTRAITDKKAILLIGELG